MNESQVFTNALNLATPAERAAYLDATCAGDPQLRAAVEALLQAHASDPGFLEQPAGSLGGTADVPPAPGLTGTPSADAGGTEQPGAVLAGRYKLLEEIGEGGMGVVWMAQQTEPVKRLVALKLIKAGMDSKQVIARFEAERQALALMDHANIARVLDAGTTSIGRPYFVMDLVKGIPITRYCDEQHLTPRQRLELFIPICQAVQHAHQKGIIHRDLKPSNVLIALYDGKPVPKVIDFGVAKAAGQPLTEKTLVTGFGALVGTLEYMSPEQAEINQLDIDTRSDIYSLGVLLYELLAGSTPFSRKDLEKAGMLEMLRVIREQEPSKPSTKLSSSDALPTLSANRGTEPAKLTKLVRGELDWIVMKALEKDRNRRYETANGFAMDVQCYLADEPVQACPPSAGYRLRKFARRNKGGLAVAALVLFFLVLLGGGVGWAARDRAARQAKAGGQIEVILAEVERLEREHKWPEALAEARRAEAVLAGGEADPATAELVRRRVKDLEFVARLEQIRMESGFVGGKFDYVREVRDYAQAFRDYGVDVEGLAAETSIDRIKVRPALAIPLAAALDEWWQARRQVAINDDAGWKRLREVACGIDPDPLRNRLRATWGMPAAKAQVELRWLAESIDVRAHHPATLDSMGRALTAHGTPDLVLRLRRDAQYAHPADFWLNIQLGVTLFNEKKDYDQAIRFFTAAVAIRPDSALPYHNVALALQAQRKLGESVVYWRKAAELDPTYRHVYHGLGLDLLDQQKYREAETALRKAIELRQTDDAYDHLGHALRHQGKLDEAANAYRKALELNPTNAVAHNNLGATLADQKKMSEAVVHFRKAVELDPKGATGRGNLGQALRILGETLRGEGKVAEALDVTNELVRLDPGNAGLHFEIGSTCAQVGRGKEAAAAFDRALELDPTNHARWYRATTVFAAIGDVDGYRRTRAKMLERFGDTDDPQTAEQTAKASLLLPDPLSETDADRVQRLAERAVTGTETHTYYDLFAMARGLAEYRAGRHADAVRWIERAHPHPNANHWDAIKFAVLAMGQHRLGRPKEAGEALANAKTILAKMPDPAKGRPLGAGDWHDWLMASVLAGEAEQMVAKDAAPQKQEAEKKPE